MGKAKKRELLLATGIILAAFAAILFLGIRSFMITRIDQKISDRLEDLDHSMEAALLNKEQDLNNYKQLLERMSALTVFFLEHDRADQVTLESLTTLKRVFSATDLFQIDLKGNVLLTTAEHYKEDFTDPYFSALKNVSTQRPISDLIRKDPDTNAQDKTYLCYQSAYYEDGTAIVLKKDWRALHQFIMESSSWESVISKDTLGGGSLLFVVSEDGTLSYNSLDKDKTGSPNQLYTDILGTMDLPYTEAAAYSESSLTEAVENAGEFSAEAVDDNELPPAEAENYDELPPAEAEKNSSTYDSTLLEELSKTLSDGWHGMLTLEGKRYYARCQKSRTDGSYVIGTALYRTVLSAILLRTGIIFTAVFILLLIMWRYSLWSIEKEIAQGVWETGESRFRRKFFGLLILFFFVTLCVCFYAECLCFYTAQTRSNKTEIEEVKPPLSEIDETQESGRRIYHAYVRTLTDLAAAMITENPAVLNTEDLIRLKKTMGVEHILVYDKDGTVIASDLNYTGLTLSTDEENLSHEFRWLLYGEPFLAQDHEDGLYLKEPYVYAGSAIIDNNYKYNGLVQIAYPVSMLQRLVNTISIKQLLASYEGDNHAFAFAVSKDDTVIHAGDSNLNLLSAESAGLTERELQDGFDGFFHLKGTRMFGCCEEVPLFYIFVAIDTSGVALGCMQRSISPLFLAAFAELLLFVVIVFITQGMEASSSRQEEDKKENPQANATNRNWHLFKQEMDLSHFLRVILICLSAGSFFLLLFQKTLFPEGSLLSYIFLTNWSKGVDIFSITKALLVVLSLYFVSFILTQLLDILGKLLPLLEQTFIRMLLSFLRFISVIGICFYVANRLGAPTNSLLASAGILSLVIGLGAQSIIKDILAGLSIIFERTFKVGDVIKLNGTRGRVIEIGIRNTKIIDTKDNNVKVVNNSLIGSITNYSTIPIFCNIDIKVTFDGPLKNIEDTMEKEISIISSQNPYVISLTYLGAEQTSPTDAVLKYQATCKAENFNSVYRYVQGELLVALHANGLQAVVSGHS